MKRFLSIVVVVTLSIASQSVNAAKKSAEPPPIPKPPEVSAPAAPVSAPLPGSLWSDVGARSLVGMNGNAPYATKSMTSRHQQAQIKAPYSRCYNG